MRRPEIKSNNVSESKMPYKWKPYAQGIIINSKDLSLGCGDILETPLWTSIDWMDGWMDSVHR